MYMYIYLHICTYTSTTPHHLLGGGVMILSDLADLIYTPAVSGKGKVCKSLRQAVRKSQFAVTINITARLCVTMVLIKATHGSFAL